MQTKICKVIAQGEPVYVQSKKSENGQLAKCYMRLRELGGEYEDEYQCTLLGKMAMSHFEPGTIVAVSMRFATHESNGVWYQDIVANEIVKINRM